jgi:DNA-binding CsgD family transcriptional regulator
MKPATPPPVTKASSRILLRQLCALRLPAMLVLPSLLPVLRQIVAAEHAAFFFCDPQGQIVNLYAERMLAPQAMASYYERHYESDFRRKYLMRVAQASPVSRFSPCEADKAGPYYREVLGVLGGDHILYGIVRRGARVLGQLSLYRGPEGPAFTAADEQALADVLHYLGEALAVPTPVPAASDQGRVAEEAAAVLSPAGETLFADAHWDRLVRLARGDSIAPATAQAEGEALPLFVRAVLAAALAAPHAVHRVESPWGAFVFRPHLMAGRGGEEVVALRVTRMTAEPLQLTLGAAELPLSPKQREVALLVARGHSNPEIAEQLGIAVNTASYHVKQVFMRLDVHDRSAVERILRQSGAF